MQFNCVFWESKEFEVCNEVTHAFFGVLALKTDSFMRFYILHQHWSVVWVFKSESISQNSLHSFFEGKLKNVISFINLRKGIIDFNLKAKKEIIATK